MECKRLGGEVIFTYTSQKEFITLLREANLQGADLRWANLREANLQGADLQEADLRWANLRGADLQEADLRWADLREADLRWADLQGADLQEADLRWANLREANLQEADLQEADLREADLQGADLRWADLRGADWDFTSFQFRCNTFDFTASPDLFCIIAYHICRIKCDDVEIQELQQYLVPFANKAGIIQRHYLPLIKIKESANEF